MEKKTFLSEKRNLITILEKNLTQLFDRVKPDFVFYLSGVDVLESDKLGKLALSKNACAKRDRLVLEKCISQNVPVQVSMGGGYSPKIKDIVDAHCNTFKVANDLYF
jgi:acetoin utilization deacetylase AcuC-like enzyme